MSPADIRAKIPSDLELLPGRPPLSSRHILAMAVGSIAVHIVIGGFFLSLPEVVPHPRSSVITSDFHRVIHLAPPKLFEPTQKAPNLNKVVHPELDVRSEMETPRAQAPRFRPPQPAPGPAARPVPAPAQPTIIEPPKIQAAAIAPPPQVPPTIAPPSLAGTIPQAPPPPESAKPKIAFENVAPSPPVRGNGPVDPRLLMPKPTFDRSDATPSRPTGGGGITVGDSGDDLALLPGFNQSQSKGKMGSNLQLLSDSTGYDFKPYLIQVLAAVRRNWMAVIPESAKMGRRGNVLIQFIIDRRGGVPKLVIATSSGTEAFDRAAVAGVSASNPFPPLPADFKGDQIRLQLSFNYNAVGR